METKTKNYNFGTGFKKRKVWIINFECDTTDVYKKKIIIHLLEQDFENEPVHAGLNPVLKIHMDTVDEEVRNTYITFNPIDKYIV